MAGPLNERQLSTVYDDREPSAKQSEDERISSFYEIFRFVRRVYCALRSYTKSLQIFETRTKLLDLNDDCLDKIFGHFDVIELCSVAQVCKRFQQLAELYVERKHSQFDFTTVFADRQLSNKEVRDVLHNFGHLMKSLTVSGKTFDNYDIVGYRRGGFMKDIAECCGERLHTLQLLNVFFTSYAVDALNMLFESLEALSLVGSVSDRCVLRLTDFSSLKFLTISDTLDCYALMCSFPALEYLSLENVSIPNVCVLHQFIVTHKQLETLIIKHCQGIASDVVRYIGTDMENLKHLHLSGILSNGSESIEQIENNILYLSELKNLQRFEWNCSYLSIGNLLTKMATNKIPLNVLHFGNGTVDDKTIKAIKKIQNLKCLAFLRTNGVENQHLIEIALEVAQLEELHIVLQQNITFDVLKEVLRHAKQLMVLTIDTTECPLDATLYNNILDIVQERRNGIKLTIKIYSTDVQDMIPQQTIQMNRNWLIIEYF